MRVPRTIRNISLLVLLVGALPLLPVHAGSVGMVADDSTDSVVVFDADSGEVRGSVSLGEGSLIGDCTIDGERGLGFVTDGDNRLWVIDVGASVPAPAAGVNPVLLSTSGVDTALDPEGRFLLVCGNGPVLAVVDVEGRAEIHTYLLDSDCGAVDICDDGSVLVASTEAGWVRRLEMGPDGQIEDTYEVFSSGGPEKGSGPNDVFCAPGSTSGGVVHREGAEIVTFSIPGLEEVDVCPLTGSGLGISGVVDRGGQRVYARAHGSPAEPETGAVDVLSFNAATGSVGQPEVAFSTEGEHDFHGVDQIALHPRGGRVFVPEPGSVKVFEAITGVVLAEIVDPSIVQPSGICTAESHSVESADDRDDDGVLDAADNCPYVSNADQSDGDGDGVGDVCDNCPQEPNPDQAESDRGRGDFDGTESVISSTSNAPRSIATWDADGDGDLDLVVAAEHDDAITWYENLDGQGSFGAPQIITTGADGVRSITVADLGAGPVVVSASAGDNTIAWWESTGVRHVISATAIGAASVDTRDVDGDGDVDVTSASASDDTIAWYENLDGTGGAWLKRLVSNAANGAVSVHGGDFDGDGDEDLASASVIDDKLAWYENPGGGVGAWTAHGVSSAADGAYSVFARDLDGDGDLDLLSASIGDDTVAWYENTDGLGHFGPVRPIATDVDGASFVCAADLDGDGDQDVLAAAILDSSVTWYENTDGLGSFGPTRSISADAGAPWTVIAADVDTDGDLDALSAGWSVGKVVWYENSEGFGDACDNCPEDYNPDQADEVHPNGVGDVCDDADADGVADSTDNCPDEANPDQSDLDGDGLGDACDPCPESIDNDADGDDLCAPDDNCPAHYNPGQDDADGDLVGDACDNCPAIPNADQSNADLDESGDACDECTDTDGDGWGNPGYAATTCDLDNCPHDANADQSDADVDGVGDVCDACTDTDGDGWGDPGYTATVCPLDNCPTTPNPDQLNLDGDGAGDVCDVCPDVWEPSQDDVDADGVGDACDNCPVDWNADQADSDVGEGRFASPQRLVTGTAFGTRAVHPADIDADGDVDLIAAATSGDMIVWYENDGFGRFGLPRTISDEGDGPWSIDVEDVDGDGDLDVVSGWYFEHTIAWHENVDGAGNFAPRRVINSAANEVAGVDAADVDGDGDMDVVAVARLDHDVLWHANDGAGNFGPPQIIDSEAITVTHLAAADLDGDGDVDLVSAAGDEFVRFHANLLGDGSLWSSMPAFTAAAPTSVTAVDIDGSGLPDLLVTTRNDDRVVWYRNLGGWTFSQHVITDSADGASSAFAADLDGDGDLDVLTASQYDNVIAWYENKNGTGAFGPTQEIHWPAQNALAVTAADLDGDGDVDAVSASLGDDRIAWYENSDGRGDACDNCPDIYNPGQEDADADDIGDLCDECTDIDGDGCGDPGFPVNTCCLDNCPDVYNDQSDVDGDGVGDVCDICPDDYDPEQTDSDGDGVGNACDNCPYRYNDDQSDVDADLTGDVCDNCPDVSNPDQADTDHNGTGDACNEHEDSDGDEWADDLDNCPLVPNTDQDNIDGDPFGDVCDNCPQAYNPDQLDVVHPDGIGDECDDPDADGVVDSEDNCVDTPNADQADDDGDDVGDVCDPCPGDPLNDVDGDGDCGEVDNCPYVANHNQLDSDDDGVGNACDNCPTEANPDQSNADSVGFGPQQLVTTSSNGATSVYTADVDGDGDEDVLSASYYDNKIAWYENLDGLGSFGSSQVITTSANGATSVHAADVDGDGDEDALSASSYDDKIAWYENLDGLGSFGPPRVITTFANGAQVVHAVDVDGDGDADVLSASQYDNKIAWYENLDGLGNYGPPQVITTSAYYATAVHAADVDGDGDVDVLSASLNDDKIAWYANLDGLGNFGPPQVITTSANGAMSVYAVDVDGDGDADVLSASYIDNKIAWYENLDGQGSFGTPRVITASTYSARSVHAADVDGDGDEDVLSASYYSVAWYENLDGQGSFGAPQVITTSVYSARSVHATDVNGDGDVDLFSASFNDDKIAWYENTERDSLGDACDNCPTSGNPDQADDDRDGVGDVCDNCPETDNDDQSDLDSDGMGDVCDSCTDVDGDGFGQPGLSGAACPDDNCPSVPNSDQSDLDADGYGDVCDNCERIANPDQSNLDADSWGDACDNCPAETNEPQSDVDADGSGDVCDNCAYLENADQSDDDDDGWGDVCDNCVQDSNPDQSNRDANGFVSREPISESADSPTSVHAADVDGDGDLDALSSSSSGDEIAWYENLDGLGSFGARRSVSTSAERAYSVYAADLDGDGDVDLLSASFNDDKIAWYENEDGLGGFGPQRVITTSMDAARSVRAADIDGDGDQDVLSASWYDDRIAWYENEDGLGSFGPPQVITTYANGADSVHAADVDGDGDTDVLSSSWFDDKIAWYENEDGLGGFGPARIISTSANGATSVYTADVDGDGDLDALSSSYYDSKIAWYENEDGLGGFGPGRVISTSSYGTYSVHAADIDGDGDVDVLASAVGSDEIAWYENLDGLGEFGPALLISNTAEGAYFAIAADLNGDGAPDVLSANLASDEIAWYANADRDSIGDACDNCPAFGNSDQADGDQDDVGDVCDNCMADPNPDQSDTDADAVGDVCDPCTDSDGDGVGDPGFPAETCPANDNCVAVPNPDQSDGDGDGTGDACDVCPDVWDPDQADSEGAGPVGVYNVSDSTQAGGPLFDFEDVSTTGTDLYLGDDQLIVVPIGFQFSFYGTDYAQAYVSSNGFLTFLPNQSSGGYSGHPIPSPSSPNAIVAGWWDDLYPPNGSVHYQTLGTAPNRRFILQFTGVPHYCCSAYPVTFQIKLLERSNVVEIHYVEAPSDGSTHTVGIENADGSEGLQYFHGNASLPGYLAVRFDMGPDGIGDACDNCVSVWNDDQSDADADGFGDGCDVCPLDFDPDQPDVDGDGVGDFCDNCPDDPNPDQVNSDGAAEFESRSISTVPMDAWSIRAADLDGDGDLDILATSTDDDTVSWYENLDGQGGFGPRRIVSSGQERSPYSIHATDLDGDGDADILCAASENDTLSWYENTDGLGTFGSRHEITATANRPYFVYSADLDGDGDQDALSASQNDDRIAWYENTDGLGTFGTVRLISGTADGATSVRAADIDGDGDIDVVASAWNASTVQWYQNLDGLGNFGPPRVIAPNAYWAHEVFIADIDGDGDPDVLSVSNGSSEVAWHENLDGAGNFGSPRLLSTNTAGPAGVHAADMDNDGDIDVLSAFFDSGIVGWFENVDGEGNFGPLQVLSTTSPGAISVIAADLDGDGDTDAASTSYGNDALRWYENVTSRDTLGDACDNCPEVNNPDQVDIDADGFGDACDNCPAIANSDQADQDADGIGDPCDSDLDGDDTPNNEDNCPDFVNPDQADGDGNGVGDACQAPDVSIVRTPDVLWPPNHHMVDVHADVVATAPSGPVTLVLVSVTSSEPDDAEGAGDGHTTDDIQDVAPGELDFDFKLRAERDGGGAGRVYTLTYAATTTNGSNRTTTASALVTVPHDQGGVVEPLQLTARKTQVGTLLEWAPVEAALHYDIVRGNVAELADTGSAISMGAVTCIESQSADPGTAGDEDSAVPPPGEAFFYAAAWNDGWTRSYGTEGVSKPRVPSSGDCP